MASAIMPIANAVTPAPSGARPVPSVQRDIDEHLRKFPGGIQVSDNAIAYGNGEAVAVFPSPGEEHAPTGLGPNVRTAEAAGMGLLAGANDREARAVEGCPAGRPDNRWYCFYEHKDYGGARWQFHDTRVGWATDWGFNDMTSSWVNTQNHKYRTYNHIDKQNNRMWDPLWDMAGNSKSSQVDPNFNDQMSGWYRL